MPSAYIPYGGPPQASPSAPEVWEVGQQCTDVNGNQWQCVARGLLGMGGNPPSFRQMSETPSEIGGLYDPLGSAGAASTAAITVSEAYAFSLAPVFPVAAPTGVAATDQANIQTAVNAAAAQNGGTVQLRAGAYAVSSSVRVDTVSNVGPGTTWTDTGITANDVGSYVLGPDIVGSGGVAGRAPKILTVTPGTSFTTDIAPGAAAASVSMWITKPGVVLLEGVKLQGTGSIVGGGTANYFSGTSSTYGTAIVDSGTGVTILTRGSNSYGSRYGLYDLVVWGGAGAWGGSGYTGAALVGTFISNNSWWFEMDNVDISYYKTAGIALDGNMNAQDFRNVSIQHVGTIGSSVPTGGILCYYFSGKVTSAGINLYNCSIDNLYGSGIAGGPGGGPPGGANLAAAINAYGCQVWNISATSWPTYSGYGAVLEGDFSSGKCSIVGCWFGTNGNGDLWANGGAITAMNTTFTSSVSSPIQNWCGNGSTGALTLIGCDVFATSANAVAMHSSNINAIGCSLQGSATNLYSGGPTAAQCLGVATSVGMTLNGTNYTNP